MKFKVDAKLFGSAVNNSSISVSCKEIAPVLKNFYLQVHKGMLIVQGTDLELSSISKIPIIDGEDGKILVDSDKLLHIAKFSTDAIEFNLTGTSATVKSGRSKHTILTGDPKEYPEILDFDEAKPFHEIDLSIFLTSIMKVMHAICEDETRKNLMAVCLKKGTFISSDGKRLATYDTGIQVDELNIPSRCVRDLVEAMRMSTSKSIKIQQNEQFLMFLMDGNLFSTRLLVVPYPPVEKQIEQTKTMCKFTAAVNRQLLLEAINRTIVSVDEETGAVQMSIKKDEIQLQSKDKVGNMSEDAIGCKWDGPDVKYYINGEHLSECLGVLDDEVVAFKMADNNDEKMKKVPIIVAEGKYMELLIPQLASF